MADINNLISLGIGSPAAIPEFITFGLQIGDPLTITTPDSRLMRIQAEDRTLSIEQEDRIMFVDESNG